MAIFALTELWWPTTGGGIRRSCRRLIGATLNHSENNSNKNANCCKCNCPTRESLSLFMTLFALAISLRVLPFLMFKTGSAKICVTWKIFHELFKLLIAHSSKIIMRTHQRSTNALAMVFIEALEIRRK